ANGQVQTAKVEPGVEVRLTFGVEMAGRVRGRVLDESGRPVSGAEIWLCNGPRGSDCAWENAMDRWLRCAGTSGGDGAFTVAFAPRETMSARLAGHAPSRAVRLLGVTSAPITLVLGGEPASLGGTVVDEQGRPVADAAVDVFTRGQQY